MVYPGAVAQPPSCLWRPSEERIRRTHLDRFRREMEAAHGIPLPDYGALWRWSLESPEDFWCGVWEFAGLVGERGETTVRDREQMPGAQWFPGAQLNFAENLLRRRDDGPALVFRSEHAARITRM